MAQKILRQGYYWPTIDKDVADFARGCNNYQYYVNIPHRPTNPIVLEVIACPFDQWGINIIGPFPRGTHQKKFLIVAVEYFTKWVEAEAVATITESRVRTFIRKNIIC